MTLFKTEPCPNCGEPNIVGATTCRKCAINLNGGTNITPALVAPTTLIPHGGYAQPSRFLVVQHKYAGGDDEGTYGFIEVLEIKDPPEGKHPIAIVFLGTGHLYQFWEFGSVDEAKEAFEKRTWDLSVLQNQPGFIRYVRAVTPLRRPWFYLEEEEEIEGDFAFSKEEISKTTKAVDERWPGRCKRCHIIWWWPKDGCKYTVDLAKGPSCPQCSGLLTRTTGASKDEGRETTRIVVGLEEESDDPPLQEDTRSRVERVFELITTMTIVELRDLNKRIEEEFGVSPLPPLQVIPSQPAVEQVTIEEQTEFSVVITSYGGNKINVIKAIRELIPIGLKEAKDLVELVDGYYKKEAVVSEGLSRADAEWMAAKLLAAGATVEIR